MHAPITPFYVSVQAEAFVAIDQQYYAALRGCTGESAGTTALAALVWGDTVYVANAGEARGKGWRSRKHGQQLISSSFCTAG